jgi:Carboxypeptidase regulatory-like domain
MQISQSTIALPQKSLPRRFEAQRSTFAAFAVIAFLLGASVCTAQQSKATAAPSPKPTGIITGRVINSAGEPLAGAGVSAGAVGSNTRPRSATTDANGEFKIEGLEPGIFRIFAGMGGYVPFFPPYSTDPSSYYRIGDSVTITLYKGGVIHGTVTGPNGPLIAIGVFPTRVRDETGKPSTSGYYEHSTDDRGMFRIFNLPPGTYVLSAAKPRLGFLAPTAYDPYSPTYFPSATRDTALEIVVHEGDEVTADIQFRAAPGYAVSGKVVGVITPEIGFAQGASLTLTNVRNRSEVMTSGTLTNDDSSFAFFGVPDGEYELVASEFLPTREELKSAPRRIVVRGADVTGTEISLAPQASIEGRLVFESDPKAACAARKETAAQETIVYARRFEPAQKANLSAEAEATNVPLSAANYAGLTVGDAKGSFVFRNLPAGSYRVDPLAPADGWFIKSVAASANSRGATKAAVINPMRDGISVKTGERISGVTVTIAEGAATLNGRIVLAEGQSLAPGARVYLVPADRVDADNVWRFYEARPNADLNFKIGNVTPGKYLIVARPDAAEDATAPKSIRQDERFRAQVISDAEALKKDLIFKPCEQKSGYELPFTRSTSPQ